MCNVLKFREVEKCPKLSPGCAPVVSFTGKNVYTLGLLRMVNRGCCDNTLLLCKTCLHAVYHRPCPMALRIKTLYFVLLGKWQLQNCLNKPFVHRMDCACLVHKICGYYYYNKRGLCTGNQTDSLTIFSMEATRSRIKMYSMYPKSEPIKNARNHGNLPKRTSELHEKAKNSKKRSQCRLFFRRM